MNTKTKDCVFSVLLLLIGGFVVIEGLRMYALAANPPRCVYRASYCSVLM